MNTTNIDPLNPQSTYEPPKSNSSYLKFEKGQTKFLPVASAVVGWEYWTAENKPVRLREQPNDPSKLPGIRQEDDGKYRVNHFWAFPVIDCASGRVKILEITQKSIQASIRAFAQNEEYGNPVMNYTFTVSRTGDGFETEYTVMANPPKEIPKEWQDAWDLTQKSGFDINELFHGGDPFNPEERTTADEDAQVEPEKDNAEPPA